MNMHVDASVAAVSAFTAAAPAASAQFEVISEGRCGLEIRHQDGAIFAFTLNASHTGLSECRRPYEGADHAIYRAAARRFAEAHAHRAGLIFCPRAA
jgi:hypothetical protein